MILTPAQKIIIQEEPFVTLLLFEKITALGIYLITIIVTLILFVQTLYIFIRGIQLKRQQSEGNENSGTYEGSLVYYLNKFSGIFLTVFSTALSQLFMRMIFENFKCDRNYEVKYGCDSQARSLAMYFSFASVVLMLFLISYSDIFLTKLFPNDQIPWSAWNENSREYRNYYKIMQVLALTFVPQSYQAFVNAGLIFFAYSIVSTRVEIPQVYNRVVHVITIIFECQLFVFSLFAFLVTIIGFTMTGTGLLYISIGGIFMALLMIFKIDTDEKEILQMSTDIKNFEGTAEVELYLVVMLHQLGRLTASEEYAQEKHVHAIVGRHMEECQNESCPCKNYEPEYDKKFTSNFSSRKFTKQFSMRFSSGSSIYKSSNSVMDLKRLPYKINYKTKVEIFKKEFEDRVEQFLEEHPKACGIKLLKSFFNHKFCDSSYKALFVQLENSITSKEFTEKVFIYHLKTQIQDEMKKSTESPLSIDINSLLRFEKFKLDFEKNLEDLSSDCQTFWTDLSKDDYNVENALDVAYKVAGKIIKIKTLFVKIININPLCIDTSSTYALIYRHMLRDEATFNDLVNKIQQIKNSSKLEQQRESGIRFFDSDIYALLMVSGEVKELGRIKQANSSTRFVFGYDPRELIGSKINKIMPAPFAVIHDKFMMNFLTQGNSNWLDKNQPLAVVTKDGFLQMSLFYIKPMVSLEFGLVFSCFARKLNLYTIADEAPEFIKINKLCTILTDQEGFIHCMSDSCSKRLGIPPPSVGQQLSINDNQMFNISQLCPQLLQQDYEFELVKGVKMQVTTTFLKKERQFRREFPEIACKINDYQAELGIHKFEYRDLKQQINIFVIKLAEKDDYDYGQNNGNDNYGDSKSEDEELTYSEFFNTTANSSVISGQMATTKFKTFKSKIQRMESSTHINIFAKISFFTFILLLGIAAGNFALNLFENQFFLLNLDVLTNLQILHQQVPDSAHATRQLVLLTNGFVKQNDSVLLDFSDVYPSKYAFYSDSLNKASQLFENIQNRLQTNLKSYIELDSFQIYLKDVKSDGEIMQMPQSIQTSINLFSSKILKISSYRKGRNFGIPFNTSIPRISFDWNNNSSRNTKVNEIQQDIYFIIENGLASIFEGIKNVLKQKYDSTVEASKNAGTISLILAAISILLVLILLPMSLSPMTQVEKVSQIIMLSLIKLPQKFCLNESKACSEITMFLNEQKEGEKSTHEMIKKHEHRKTNKQLLKLPRSNKNKDFFQQDSMLSSNLDSDGFSEAGQLISKETRSIESIGNKSSKVTQLSNVKVQDNAQEHLVIKRNQAGTIDLELIHAKTSEIQDDYINSYDQLIGEGNEPSEEEQQQIDREALRTEDITKTFKKMKIKKFLWLIVTAFIISIYYAVTCFYLSLIHQYERVYLEQYSLIGRRIQCYTNQVSYLIDSLARNTATSGNSSWSFIEDCYIQEESYKQMLLDGLTTYSMLDTFNSLNDELEGENLCKTLSQLKEVDGLRIKNISFEKCLKVYQGILTNGGLTATLFHFLRGQQDVMLLFEDRQAKNNNLTDIQVIKNLLFQNETNELITLNQIYLRSAFEYLRNQALSITQNYFKKLTNYYNLIFGFFVGLLSVFQIFVSVVLIKKLTKQIIKIYHVVLLIPLSGRTQNELSELMFIQM